MIIDKLNFAPTFKPSHQGAVTGPTLAQPPAGKGAAYGPTDSSAVSSEASEPDGGGAIGPLLQGLQSWGGPEAGGAPAGQVGQTAQGQGVAGQGQPPSQVPLNILHQVLNTLKTAGGMATAGALHSLLSWGSSELENSGKIRPEFQEILREAISFAKENQIMSPEDLAKYEARLFAGGEGGGSQEGGGAGCSCGKKGKGILEGLERLKGSKAA